MQLHVAFVRLLSRMCMHAPVYRVRLHVCLLFHASRSCFCALAARPVLRGAAKHSAGGVRGGGLVRSNRWTQYTGLVVEPQGRLPVAGRQWPHIDFNARLGKARVLHRTTPNVSCLLWVRCGLSRGCGCLRRTRKLWTRQKNGRGASGVSVMSLLSVAFRAPLNPPLLASAMDVWNSCGLVDSVVRRSAGAASLVFVWGRPQDVARVHAETLGFGQLLQPHQYIGTTDGCGDEAGAEGLLLGAVATFRRSQSTRSSGGTPAESSYMAFRCVVSSMIRRDLS